MPHTAIDYKINRNLKAKASKVIKYKVPKLKKGDEIKTKWVSYIINPKIAKKLDIKTIEYIKPYIGSEESVYIY
jgi:hypothetical protein